MAYTPDRDNEEMFRAQVEHYATPVIRLCEYALAASQEPDFPCRDFLNRLHSDARRLQELLDHHGAQHNERWFPFRESVAAAKLFSDVTYAVRHIRGSLGHYELTSVQADCREKSDAAVALLRSALVAICEGVIEQAARCSLEPEERLRYEPRRDPEFHFKLASDRTGRHVEKVDEAVVHLATSFLNLSEDREVNEVFAEHECPKCAELVPYPISEESLRSVESMFHNLQSMYDTYIFETDVEEQNSDLGFMRGHISIIFHLTEIATNLVHYYVRHMSPFSRGAGFRFPIEREALLEFVFDYPLRFSRLYLESAVQLCQRMIRAYSVPASVEVPIPNYRGFHVRPSTLVARIVRHYGSSITMVLGSNEYDAGSPIDLFRANEEINAAKRRLISDLLVDLPNANDALPANPTERSRQVHLIIMSLVREGSLVTYDTDLNMERIEQATEPTIAGLAAKIIRHSMSMGKMDVRSDITVTFCGDSRAVADIRILANSGYGEDRMGSNIELPGELSYLAR